MKRTMRWTGYGSVLLLALAVLAAAPARAQEQEEEKTDTGVARISLIRGEVFMTRGDSGDQVAAKINIPLVRGDKVFTGEKAQAEIQLDHSNIIRLAPGAEIRIADLTRSQIQLQVAKGLVNYTVLKTNEAQIELDTPNMAVRPVKDGSYRIQVTSPTETLLIVRKGDADVTTPEGTTKVDEGRIIMVRGSDKPEYQLAKAPDRDDWDKWNNDRDKEIQNAKSYKYANHYYTGAQDLDRNGRWEYIQEYGDYAWTPYVSAGWAPYSAGYWGWAPYWGWTWTSYEPWGWAPYHYGRWFCHGSSWYWWPGGHSYGYYPTWGPGWVSWIGFGYGGFNWGFGFGYGYNSIGWCPLGPYDRHYSWWGHHNGYNAVNITNITNITNINNYNGRGGNDGFGRGGYQSNLRTAMNNANVRGGITRVSTEDFMRGNFSRAQRGVDAGTLREGQLVRGQIPVAPTRENLGPISNNSRAAAGNSGAERFFSRREAPTVARNFNEQAASVQNMMRNTNVAAAPGREGAASVAGNGFTRSGSAAGGNAAASTGATNPGASGASAAGTTFGRGRELNGSTVNTIPQSANSASRGATDARGATAPASAGSFNRGTPNPASSGQPGWQTFGQRGGQAVNGQADTQVAQRNAQAQPSGQAAGQAGQAAPTQTRSWQRFGTGQPRVDPNRATTTGAAPQAAQSAPGRSGQSGFGAQNSRGTELSAPRVEGGYTPSQGGAGSAAPSGGWRRFGAQTDSSGAGRPAMDIRKSITTERAAPRVFQGGGGQAGLGSSAPVAAPRSFEGSGSAAPRGFQGGGGASGSQGSAPSSTPRSFEGTGRAAPSSTPRSFQGGGGNTAPRSFERSAPSSASGGYTAPRSFERSAPSGGYSGGGNRGYSAPSGSYGGGNRTYSAPSGGYGGGGGSRGGSSAPSGGGHASAPSGGGGHSAPSGGHGGGSRR
jgi:hypothetical protein